MARRDKLKICPVCGEVNPAEGISCKACFADLTGTGSASSGQSQLAQLHRMVKRLESINSRLTQLLFSFWLVAALFVIWMVLGQAGGLGGLLPWPF